MDALNNFEKTVAGWYKNVPHLPKNFTDWLASNIWWLVIIGVVISVLGLFTIVPLLLLAFGLSTGMAASVGYIDGGAYGSAWLSILLSLIALVFTTILEIMAINPLKRKAKLGWTLLFAVALFNFVFNIVLSLVTMNFFGILSGVLWAAVWGYFLFEIHGYFGVKAKAEKKIEKKV